MTAPRAKFLLAAAASTLPFAAPVSAQVADGVVINIMRECAKIEDPSARLACYDNNIRQAGPGSRASVPGQVQSPAGQRRARQRQPDSEQGFGYEDVRTSAALPDAAASEAQQINPAGSPRSGRANRAFTC